MEFCKTTESLAKVAQRFGYTVGKTIDGRFQLKRDGKIVGVYNRADEAKEWIHTSGHQTKATIDGSIPIRDAEVGGGQAPRFHEALDLSPVRSWIASAQVSLLSRITPIKQFAQNVEKFGFGPAFKSIYAPTQDAIKRVDELLGNVRHAKFGGKTYEETLTAFEREIAGLTQEEKELITYYSEAMTKNEVAGVGGFSSRRAMTDDEIAIANYASESGLAEDLPRIIALDSLISTFLRRRDKFDLDYKRLSLDISEGKLPKELQPFLDRMRDNVVGTDKKWADVAARLELTDKEISILGFYRDAKDKHDWARIYRHAAAPELRSGFKNGREQFAADRGMHEKLTNLAHRRDEMLEQAFGDFGFNKRAVVDGQMPVYRKFMEAGLMPDENATKGLYAHLEATEVVNKRVINGWLSPYNVHPTVSAFKHIRNLAMKQEFDPAADAARNAIRHIADERSANVMREYLSEVEGIPHDSFRQLTKTFKTAGRAIGVNVDDSLAQQIVGTLTRLTYKSTIPFRPGLVVRNYFQTLFFTAPTVGPKAWLHGVKEATQNYKSAMDRAIKAGAIDVNVVPLFASDEVLGVSASRFTDKLGPKIAKAGFEVDQVFNRGFSWYRDADDWGRVVAFEAGAKRVRDGLDRFRKGELNYEQFKEVAKVKTFDETIEASFDRLIQAGDFDGAADYIGKELADKTHLLYGHANHPHGWGSWTGKLFGQFGTFPVQYLNYVTESLTRGTIRDRAEWAAMHSALNAAIPIAGAELAGVDLWNWATFGSLTYTGGPYTEMAVNLVQAASGSDAEKSLARRNLYMMLPSLQNPESLLVPGSYAVGDWWDAAEAFSDGDWVKVGLEAAGIRSLKQGQKVEPQKFFDFVGGIVP